MSVPQPKQVPIVDLRQPLAPATQPVPVFVNVVVPNLTSMSEGVPSGPIKVERYVLLSALPRELRDRVDLAIQALVAGG